MKTIIVAVALAFCPSMAYAVPVPAVQVTPVTRTHTSIIGQPIVVPDHPDVVVSLATFPPGARLPEHQHPNPHYVYVLEGVLTVVNTDANQTFQVKAGDFVVEMTDTWHYGINNGTVAVKLLVIDQVPHGAASNVVPRKP